MKPKNTLLLSLLFVLFLIPSVALADGFAVYEWSAGGSAMSGAYMFAEDDPSVLAYNPAGITHFEGSWLSLGTTFVTPASHLVFYKGTSTQECGNENTLGVVPAMFYIKKHSDKLWWGVGVFPRFGNASKFSPDFPGKYNCYSAAVESITIQPTLAFKASDKLSLALGADIMYMSLNIKNKVLLPVFGDMDTELDGSNIALGWNISLNYDFDDKTSFAALYRSRITHNMDADMNMSTPGISSRAHGSVTLPDNLTLGLGHKFNDKTRIEIGATYTDWSVYDVLNIRFDNSIIPSPPFPAFTEMSDVKNWKATWRYQIGIEHKINDKWSLLGGYSYDFSSMPDDRMDFSVVTGDRRTAGIGCKWRNKNAEFTFAWGFMWITDRTIPVKSYADTTQFDYARATDNTSQVFALTYTLKLN